MLATSNCLPVPVYEVRRNTLVNKLTDSTDTVKLLLHISVVVYN